MLTPEQTRDLVEHFGSKRAAAHEIGVPRTTLLHWLDPEVDNARFRRHYEQHSDEACARVRRYQAEHREERRAAFKAWYEGLSGVERCRFRLRTRRNEARRRMRKRHGGEVPNEDHSRVFPTIQLPGEE